MTNVKWTFLFFLTIFISLGATAHKSDIEAVKQTLDNYKQKIESLDTITLKDDKEVKSQGFATSLLQKVNRQWKIKQTHSSFRKAK